MAAPQAASNWELLPLFLNPAPFSLNDPLFDLDIGFFVFRLPMLSKIYNWLTFVVSFAAIASAAVYLLYRGIVYGPRGLGILRAGAQAHAGPRGVVFSRESRRVLFGRLRVSLLFPGGRRSAQVIPMFTLFCRLCGSSVFYHWRRQLSACSKCPARDGVFSSPAIAVLLVAHVIGVQLYPYILQRFRVIPNEVDAERAVHRAQYQIYPSRLRTGQDRQSGISGGRTTHGGGYKTQRRHHQEHPAVGSPAVARQLRVRLQEIRTYYKFVDVDNDRYVIDGNYRQVMLSARELSHQHLQSRNWINEHLTFTHGHGVVFGPVNQVTRRRPAGVFYQGHPAGTRRTSLKVTRPEIYYGELANEYVLVKTSARNWIIRPATRIFIQPMKAEAALASVHCGASWFFRRTTRRLESCYRRISSPRAASFITGRSMSGLRRSRHSLPSIAMLTWSLPKAGACFGSSTATRLQTDTLTRNRCRQRQLNYIRNSVKAVIDAYNGTVDFYLADPKDPLVAAYGKIFPGLFKPLEQMPEDLHSHIRYPQDIFAIQAQIYATYHMQDPQVFYNKEDLLSIPRQSMGKAERRHGTVLHHHAPTR